jgi:hypothetical protein
MITTTLAAVPSVVPCKENSRITVATTKYTPSISNPTCVTQLNSATGRFPFWPNGARLTMNAVVPVFGPPAAPGHARPRRCRHSSATPGRGVFG